MDLLAAAAGNLLTGELDANELFWVDLQLVSSKGGWEFALYVSGASSTP